MVAGGVARNAVIRQKLLELGTEHNLVVNFPPLSLCTDNGAMIAWAAIETILNDRKEFILIDDESKSKVEMLPKWPLSKQDPVFESSYPDSVKYHRKGLKITVYNKMAKKHHNPNWLSDSPSTETSPSNV